MPPRVVPGILGSPISGSGAGGHVGGFGLGAGRAISELISEPRPRMHRAVCERYGGEANVRSRGGAKSHRINERASARPRARPCTRLLFFGPGWSEYSRHLLDAVPQPGPALERHIDWGLFLLGVGKARALHFFGGSLEASCAHRVHRQEAKSLRQGHTVGPGLQKFNVCVHFSENRAQRHFPGRTLRDRPSSKQDRSPRRREALDRAQQFLIVDCKDGSFLIRDTDSGRPVVLDRFGSLSRHCDEDYKGALGPSTLRKFPGSQRPLPRGQEWAERRGLGPGLVTGNCRK
jgi:hypothetical protein